MARSKENNLYMQVAKRAQRDPDGELLVVDDRVLRNGDFVEQTTEIAAALFALGLKRGDRVGIILPNAPEWYTLFWAAVRIGLVPVPFDPQIGAWELERLLNLTEIKICFAAPQYRQNRILEHLLSVVSNVSSLDTVVVAGESLQLPDNGIGAGSVRLLDWYSFIECESQPSRPPIAAVDESDTLMPACTSGSTGAPKIIVVPHVGFGRSQSDMAKYLGFGPSDVMLLGMPLYHQGGFGMGLQMLLGGGAVCYQSVFDPARMLHTVEEFGVSVLQLSPTTAKILISAPEFDASKLSTVRIVYFAGEVLPWETARVFIEDVGARTVNIVGSTETATMLVWDSAVCKDTEVNTYRTLPFTKVRLLDDEGRETPVGEVGRIHVHTDALLTEYFKNEEETARRLSTVEGVRWFDTGDLGIRCEDERVRFTGRAKRAVKRGGNLVYPEEIECFLLTHPDVEAAAVVGEPHPLIGEQLTAFIQPRKGVRFTRRDMVRFCSGALAAYKIPDKTVVVETLPTDIGKVQYKYLRTAVGRSQFQEDTE